MYIYIYLHALHDTPLKASNFRIYSYHTTDETETQLRNNLYTACKVGDEAKLDECLREINALTVSQPPEAEPSGTQCTQTSEGPSSEGGVMDPRMKPDSVLNTSFGDKFTTLLHVASQNGHSKLISPLLEAGADPTNRWTLYYLLEPCQLRLLIGLIGADLKSKYFINHIQGLICS